MIGLWLALSPASAHAELGGDLALARAAFEKRGRATQLKLRLLERGEVTPVVLPPWAFDDHLAECTTLLFLSPVPTQLVVHLRPWPGLPPQVASGAGAVMLTRCGRDRVSLLGVAVEMRSPRAVVHTLVGIGADAAPALSVTLPEREPGPSAALGDPGPPPSREPLEQRLARLERSARGTGASGVEIMPLTNGGYARLLLAPGCHRLVASAVEGAPPYVLLLAETESDTAKPERIAASESGDASRELCTARPKRLLLSVEGQPTESERRLFVAHFPAPSGLPQRFGAELAGRLLESLGGSAAPQRLGPLVVASLGAQGRTPLPRALLPQTCYLAAAVALHGSLTTLSLGARVGTHRSEATSGRDQPGPHLGFCTGASGQVELDVEARGAGVAWAVTVFQQGPARPGTN